MERIGIDYRDLEGVHPAYVEKLLEMEPAVRSALEEFAGATSVRWSCTDDGKGNYSFRLVTDLDDCIAQVSPLDLTLEPEQFEKMLAEGKRSCSNIPR